LCPALEQAICSLSAGDERLVMSKKFGRARGVCFFIHVGAHFYIVCLPKKKKKSRPVCNIERSAAAGTATISLITVHTHIHTIRGLVTAHVIGLLADIATCR